METQQHHESGELASEGCPPQLGGKQTASASKNMRLPDSNHAPAALTRPLQHAHRNPRDRRTAIRRVLREHFARHRTSRRDHPRPRVAARRDVVLGIADYDARGRRHAVPFCTTLDGDRRAFAIGGLLPNAPNVTGVRAENARA